MLVVLIRIRSVVFLLYVELSGERFSLGRTHSHYEQARYINPLPLFINLVLNLAPSNEKVSLAIIVLLTGWRTGADWFRTGLDRPVRRRHS